MLNFFRFIYRNHIFFLFLLLQVISVGLIIQNSTYHNSIFLNSSNTLIGGIYEVRQNITDYFGLKRANDQLARENVILRSATKESFLKIDGEHVVINDTTYKQQYQYLEAKVINNTTNKRMNTITINRGTVHGIETGMGVISGEGVVGVINKVSSHYASVIPLIHLNSMLSAKIERNHYFGIVGWNGVNYRIGELRDIPAHADVQIDDRIVTRGASAIFPEGLPIGKIVDITLEDGQAYYEIDIEWAVDYSRVYHVYVVNNLLKEEHLELEETKEDV